MTLITSKQSVRSDSIFSLFVFFHFSSFCPFLLLPFFVPITFFMTLYFFFRFTFRVFLFSVFLIFPSRSLFRLFEGVCVLCVYFSSLSGGRRRWRFEEAPFSRNLLLLLAVFSLS